jgi:hypothetical protein
MVVARFGETVVWGALLIYVGLPFIPAAITWWARWLYDEETMARSRERFAEE